MEVFLSKNTKLLLDTIKNPSIYSKVVDDQCPDINSISLDDDLFIVECIHQDIYRGCFLVEKKSEYHADFHSLILDSGKGMVRRFCRMMINLLFKTTNILIITCMPPKSNKIAENTAKKVGFLYCGEGKSFIMNGAEIGSSMYLFHRGMSWDF